MKPSRLSYAVKVSEAKIDCGVSPSSSLEKNRLLSFSGVTPGIGLSPPASRVRIVTGRPPAQATIWR